MHLITRYQNEGVVIRLGDDVDPETPIGDVLAEPIAIQVVKVNEDGQVQLGFSADPAFSVVNEEAVNDVVLPHGL